MRAIGRQRILEAELWTAMAGSVNRFLGRPGKARVPGHLRKHLAIRFTGSRNHLFGGHFTQSILDKFAFSAQFKLPFHRRIEQS